MQFCRKRHFTLLEILIVLFILAFGTALTGIKIKQAYHEQRFLAEVEQIASHLRMAQDLMLIMQMDASIQFAKDEKEKQYYYQFKTTSTTSKPNLNKILQKKYYLSSVKKIDFEGETKTKSEEGLLLDFYSKGMFMTEGKLILYDNESGKEGKNQQIQLYGYPYYIFNETYKPSGLAHNRVKKQNFFPVILLEENNNDDQNQQDIQNQGRNKRPKTIKN